MHDDEQRALEKTRAGIAAGLTFREAGRRAGVSRWLVSRWLRAGQLDEALKKARDVTLAALREHPEDWRPQPFLERRAR